jgi:hypothetical protein
MSDTPSESEGISTDSSPCPTLTMALHADAGPHRARRHRNRCRGAPLLRPDQGGFDEILSSGPDSVSPPCPGDELLVNQVHDLSSEASVAESSA